MQRNCIRQTNYNQSVRLVWKFSHISRIECATVELRDCLIGDAKFTRLIVSWGEYFRRFVECQPIKAQLADSKYKTLEVHGLSDIAVGAQTVGFKNILLFA